MDTSKKHSLQTLFFQLGLSDEAENICKFIEKHRPLPRGVTLAEAEFWNKAQADFLTEAIMDDSDWCMLVDELDICLREEHSNDGSRLQ